ncbi:hypothetical protein H2204_001410 [Knufia peltigerae]|uniref:Uncharacterized protein n=1 Tax=Knufia peltigerae TaxID=1002370 RepID=A0AA38YDF6_9EURO|nr:hypothetical protein H2204_001410 [Knufia peltigerae]
MDNNAEEEGVNQSSLRLLILAPASDPTSRPPFSSLLHAITGVKPSDEVTSFSGYTTHPPLSLRTKYYSTDINIWCDELPVDTNSSRDTSQSQVLSSETRDTPVVPSNGTKSESEKGSSSDKPPAADFDLGADSAAAATTTTTPATTTLQEWTKQMLSPAASEVRAVIGGIILILPAPSPSTSSPLVPQSHIQLIESIHSVREAIEDESYHGELASVVVVQPSSSDTASPSKLAETCDHLEEVCLSEKGILGWDFISWNGQVPSSTENEGGAGSSSERNEYGERTGIHRAIEVLEGVDWSASPFYNHDDDDDGFDIDGDDEFDDFGNLDGDKTKGGVSMASVLRNARRSGLDYELQREMMELKIALDDDDDDDDDDEDEEKDGDAEEDDHHPQEKNNSGGQSNTSAGDDDDDDDDENIQVEQLQGLMDRVVAIRDAGSELPPAERGRFAKREINKIMRELGSST